MSGNPSRGRGSNRGSDRGATRGGARGGSRGGIGSSPARGSSGGPPGRDQTIQVASRGGPPGIGDGDIYLGGQPVPEPDQSVTATENALVHLTRDRNFDGFPGRRGYGTKGRPIVLRTNYFVLRTAYEDERPDMEKTLYSYDVEVSPEISKPKRRRLFDMVTIDAKFNGIAWASDFAKTIVTTEEIKLDNGVWELTVTLPPVGGDSQPSAQGPAPTFVQNAQSRNRFRIKITRTGSFAPRHMIEYLRSPSGGAEYAGRGTIITLLNIIMCKPPNASQVVTKSGQNKFYPFEGHPGMEKYDLGYGLQAMRGYFSSVRPAVGRLLVNLNVTSGAFYKPISLMYLLDEFSGTLDQQEAFIRMLKVIARYKKDNEQKPSMTKTKTIVGFATQLDPPTFRVKRFGNAREVKFRYTDNSMPSPQTHEVTVYEYFRRERGITLQHPNRPVLNCGTRADPQYMPMELCSVLPGQPYNRLLSGDQTSDMLKFAARYPNLNAMSIAGTAQSPGTGLRLFRLKDPTGHPNPQTQSVQPFGFRVNTDMITVPGRILASPEVKYMQGAKPVEARFGSWNCAGQKFVRPGRFGKWQVLIINRQGPRGNALIETSRGDLLAPEPLFDRLGTYLKDYGLTMGQRAPTQTTMLESLIPLNRDSNNRKLVQAYQMAEDQGVQLLLVVLPEADRWLYARIKYYGDVQYGIHTINVVGSKMQKSVGQGMYMGNLALKFNIKGGGVSHIVPSTLTKPLDNSTMLMGIDVTHPSPGSTEGAPSIACVVASIDEHLTQWPGSVRTQSGRQEMVQGLKAMVCERLDLWRRKHNGGLPTKIILYRDGVSEGQYELVLREEMPPFYEAFKERYGAEPKWPKMAVIIVGKRHHTRFYPTRQQDADYNAQREKGSWNPLPGTIVDRHISGRILREFWLQAHQGLQGTARPAHYVVIKDDIAFEADDLEQFTHKLCYLFNRATKAVSICPPAYYADLLCERGRAYLFSTLAENHGSNSSVFDEDSSEWTDGVHERLKDSTWYI